ncbi:long-chain fatty acid transporter fat1 [Neodidymelliopsis sp. IMI 364377]|nr:long-chain fatty acid transporter fat1 [Neodidymelliopsis sp. IMI 364377]
MAGKQAISLVECSTIDAGFSALPLAIPAAAAGLAYLNARHGVSYDWPLLSSFVTATVSITRAERRDQLNLFYELETHARSSRADHVWVIFHGQTWTYKQAYDVILRYGVWLKGKGVGQGDIVAMDFVNSETFIWVWFGLWSIGAKPAFINYNLTGKSLIHTIKTSTASLVLVDEETKANFAEHVMAEHGFVPVPATATYEKQANYDFEVDQSEVPRSVKSQALAQVQQQGITATPQQRRLEIVFFDKQLQDSIQMLQPIRQPDSCRASQKRNSMAMLIYTSGTTGLPKPAVMSWGKCNGGAKYASGWLGIKDDIVYTSMPLYHSSASVLGVCAVLCAGSTICISSKFSHKTFWPEIIASKATILHYVGETCRYLLSAPPSPHDKSHSVRAAFGNGLRPDVWEPFKERFNIRTIFEFYAATEAPGGMWNRSDNTFSSGAIGRNGTLGTLLSAPNLCVVRTDPDADGAQPLRSKDSGLCQICDWNEPGELLFKLDPKDIAQKFQGYFGNDKATNSKIVRDVKKKGDAYFRSGDLMRWDKEGRWWFVDRIGDTFRWKSENVSTAEVADAVGRHAAVEEAAVYGVQVPGHDGRAGCATVVLNSLSSNDEEIEVSADVLRSLAAHVQKELPAFARPIWLRVTRQMQTTGTNKQQKHVLQMEGIDLRKVEQAGDRLYWLSGGTYVPFTGKDFERIEGGGVKL